MDRNKKLAIGAVALLGGAYLLSKQSSIVTPSGVSPLGVISTPAAISLAPSGIFIAAATITNTGNVNRTFGVGLSLVDSANNWWSLTSGSKLKAAPGDVIQTIAINKGANGNWSSGNITLDSSMPAGTYDVVVSVYKESALPVGTALDTSKATGAISLQEIVSATIGTITVTKV